MRHILLLLFTLLTHHTITTAQMVMPVGIAQDGGYPHIGCQKACCKAARQPTTKPTYVVALALADTTTHQWWLLEATPDIDEQLHLYQNLTHNKYSYLPNGILLTHAHIGHYAGLMYLGREALNSHHIPVYAMPRMADYLLKNGPWQQLTTLDNIHILPLQNNVPIQLSPSIAVTPIQVPHRDEYSETVGYRIQCGQKRILFIPDIDKWEKWSTALTSLLDSTDIAFLDATFYDASELPNRNIKEVPHPFVSETIQLLGEQSARLQKVHFIHYNHTNPLLYQPKVVEQLLKTGAHMALQGQWY